MKQTKNAIKFLLAQYRAVYTHAILKNMLTGTVLALGLATSATQATANNLDEANQLPNSGETVSIIGSSGDNKSTFDKIQFTSGDLNVDGVIEVQKGEVSANYINSSTGKTTLKGDGTLRINGAQADSKDQGLALSTGTSGDLEVTLKEIEVRQGKLSINSDNSEKTATISSNLTIGGIGSNDATTRGSVDLNGSQSIKLGKAASTTDIGSHITIKNNGKLYVSPNSSKVSIDAENFYIKDGGLASFNEGATITSHNVDVEKGGSFWVKSGETVSVNLVDHAIDPTSKKVIADKSEQGVFHVQSGANFGFAGTIALKGGLLLIDDEAKLYGAKQDNSDSAVATIAVSGTTTTNQETFANLKISANQLANFLNGKVSNTSKTVKSGSVTVSGANSTIEFNDPEVDLYKLTTGINSIKITADGSSGAGVLSVQNSIIKADKIIISNSGDNFDLSSGTLVSKDLVLGSSTYDNSKEIKFNRAKSTNLIVDSSKPEGFKLAHTVELSSTSKEQDKLVAQNGIIQGKLLIAYGGEKPDVTVATRKGLIIDGGRYTASDTITLSGGAIHVNSYNDESETPTLESSLVIDHLHVDAGAKQNNDVFVYGKNTSVTINKLTISGDATYPSKQSSPSKPCYRSEFTAASGGVINLDASDVQAVFDAITSDTASKKGVNGVKFFAREDGTINIDGNITLNFDLGSNTSFYLSNVFDIRDADSSQSLGTGLLRTQGLTYNFTLADNSATSYKVEIDEGTYETNDLTINGYQDNHTDLATITLDHKTSQTDKTGGHFLINKSLTSNATTLETSAADFFFGKVKETNITENEVFHTGVTSGNITVKNFKFTGDGTATFESGVWTGQNFEIASATSSIKVGLDTPHYTTQDKLIETSLKGEKLTVSAGKFTVSKYGIANFDELHATASNSTGLIIDGFMSIKGTEVKEDTDTQTVAVKLNSNSITVNNGGELVFDTLAVNNSIFDKKDGDTVLFKKDIAADAITLENNGKVKLEFDKSVSFNQAQLTSLKKHLFANADVNGKINGVLHIGSAGIDGISEHIKDDGKGNPTIAWDKLQGVADIEQNADVTNDKLINAKVTGVNSDFKSQVGSLETTSTQASIAGNSSLNNAQGNNGLYASTKDGKVANVSIKNNSTLNLKNGGEIGSVSFNDESSLVTGGQGTTIIAGVTGTSGSFTANAEKTVVSGRVNVKNFEVSSKGNLEIGDTLSTTYGDISGNLVAKGTASFTKDLDITGSASFEKDLKVSGYALIEGNTQVSTTATFDQGLELANNASLKAKEIKLGQDQLITVGRVAGSEGKLTWEDSSGFLQAERLDLNKGTIIADPSYGNKASIVALNELGSKKAEKNTAGSLDGRLIAAQNSIIALGVGGENVEQHLNEAFLNKFIDSKGSLNGEELGAVAYVAKGLTVQNGSQIIVDSQLTTSSYKKDGLNPKQAGHDVYLAENSALVIDEKALSKDKAAVYFDKDGATIYGDGGKVLLSGAVFAPGKNHNIFAAKSGEVKAVTDGTKKLRFESISGLFYQDFANGETLTNIDLKINEDNLENAFYDATDSVKESLLIYSVKDHDWLHQDPDNSEPLTNGLAKGLTYDKTTGQITDKDGKVYHENNYVLIFDKDGNAKVYNQANNRFLERVLMDNNDGSIADKAANIGIYGGVAQSALAVGSATNDAISSRMGVGGQSNLTFANNGQGAGLWVSPLYKNYESEGFKAQNLKYGVDMDMYGLALGGDYTMTNGLRMGLMFNVGSGDADGQQAAQGVKNDFDFFGFGLYGDYEMNNFSIMADVSYSVADNDVKTSSSIDKISASLDSKALSLGVTGQYKLALNGLNVVPHAGLRFTRIDMDDYSIKGEKYGHIADVDSEDLNIFSIPVGVSISKDIVAGTWTVKPSFDLTLTGNFGDDVAKSKVDWTGVDNLITDVKGEVIDSFTYGASLGIAAQSGNFSFGLGTNYTGSSNTDEFGVNANARFVF